MRIGVCIRAKDEQKIIGDWVNHYLKLDFDKIIIYDNMSNPPISETLQQKGISSDRIEIKIDTFPYSGQAPVYQEAINNNKDLDWLFLCDADEFLWIYREKTVKQWLETFSSDTCTILVNWLVFGTGGRETYDTSKSVFEQFTTREHFRHFWNGFGKSIIRPSLIEKFGDVHQTYNENYKVRNVYNRPITFRNDQYCSDPYFSNNTPVVLVHYMTLDFESMLSKHKRNKNGWLLENSDCKYTLEWYKSNDSYGFRDSTKDIRMLV
jgi:hypothetical protein